jgi:hypothetical protein
VTTEIIGYSSSARCWNHLTGDIMDPIDVETARSLHDAGGEHGVVMSSPAGPVTVALTSNGKHSVHRYDPTGRKDMEFRALEPRGPKLWLHSIHRRNGGRGQDRSQLIADWFTWEEPGAAATWTRFDIDDQRGRLVEARDAWDPDLHWFEPPAFGHYDDLIAPDLLARVWPDVPPLPWLGP